MLEGQLKENQESLNRTQASLTRAVRRHNSKREEFDKLKAERDEAVTGKVSLQVLQLIISSKQMIFLVMNKFSLHLRIMSIEALELNVF